MSLIYKIFQKKKAEISETIKKSRSRIDENLPFKINEFLKIDKADFILNNDLKCEYPGKEVCIKAIGLMEISGKKVVRYYVEGPEAEEAFIQSIQLPDKTWEHTLFTNYDEVYPDLEEDEESDEEDADTWSFWLSEEDGMIGYESFGTEDDEDDDDYERVWSSSDSERVNPLEATETIYADPYDDENSTVNKHMMMMYEKEVNDTTESLLLSAIEGKEEALISIDIGIKILLN